MKKKLLTPLIIGSLLLSALSCKSVVGPSSDSTVTTYQGEWTGTTADGLAVSFTIVGNTVTSFRIELRNAVGVVISYASSDTATISADSFNVYVKPPESEEWPKIVISIPVSGGFSSLTIAQGSAASQPSVSWTAQKN